MILRLAEFDKELRYTAARLDEQMAALASPNESGPPSAKPLPVPQQTDKGSD
jgi:predicted pyridoxine 5'-phosphate oxidase superfamily flavin-nucleotide-binding protein